MLLSSEHLAVPRSCPPSSPGALPTLTKVTLTEGYKATVYYTKADYNSVLSSYLLTLISAKAVLPTSVCLAPLQSRASLLRGVL